MRTYSHLSSASGLFLAAVIGLAGVAGAQGPALPDGQVEANVLRALAGAPELATQPIKATTVDGTVTLSGSAVDEPSRKLAETLASRAQGVQKVVDELTLSGGQLPGAEASTDSQTGALQGAQTESTGQVLQSDGTYAPAPGADQQAQAAPSPAQQPGYQAPVYQSPDGSQAPPSQYPQQTQQYPADGSGPGGPPVYRRPYSGGAPQYGQRQAPVQYGGQEAGTPVTIPAGALVRMRLVEGLTAKRIKAGTIFDGTVLNDVIADGEVAIPRGASVQGTIVESNPSGAVGGKGELALQLTSVSLSGKNYPIVSDTWTHYGRSKTGQTVGNAIGLGAFGALIGAVAGGGPGAAIGAAAGGAAGVGVSAASGRGDVVIPPEAIISFHLVQPAAVTTVSQAEMDRLGYGVQQSNVQRRPLPPPGYYPYGRPVYYPYPY